MRLAGKEKGGHYPTPPVRQAQIVRHLRYPADRPVRILDPTAGKGAAILAAARVNPLAASAAFVLSVIGSRSQG